MNLIKYLDVIENLNPLEQRLSYNAKHWLDFQYHNPSVLNHVKYISENYHKSISRNDIISYFRKDDSILIRGFVLTMIWGHGSSEYSKADNRGPWKVSEMLKDINNVEQILDNAKKFLLLGDLESAHLSFKKMQRCRVNFFSKFLYFLGRSLNIEEYPLIFDARVATTINRLVSTDDNLTSILDVLPKQDANSYKLYVKKIHVYARTHRVESEKIEFFLFNGLKNI
jgi:hypothetical protein